MLLPWLTSLAKNGSISNLSELVECLLDLLGDESGILSDKVKAEIMEICQAMSETL